MSLNPDPGSNPRSYQFDDQGRLEVLVDAQGSTTLFGYSPRGLLESWSDPRAHVHLCTDYTCFVLFDGDRPCAAIDPRGGLTRLEYDDRGALIRRTEPNGIGIHGPEGGTLDPPRWATALRPIDDSGDDHLIALLDPDGTFFPLPAPRTMSRAARPSHPSLRSVYGFDGSLRLVGGAEEPAGDDAGLWGPAPGAGAPPLPDRPPGRGRPWPAVEPDPATTHSSPRTTMTRYTTPGSHRRAFEFAHDGRVTALTDAQGRTTRFEYTRCGTLNRWTGPGGRLHECSHFTFVVLFEGDRPCAAIDPRGGVTRLEYDAEGRPWRRTEPDGEFTQAAEGRALALPRWARILRPVVGSGDDSLIAVADPDGVFFPRDTLRLPPRDERAEDTGAATTSQYVYQFDGSRLEPGPEADPAPAAVAVG